MSNNDLQTDTELLIHLREELEARNIIGSDYVLDTMLDGVLHHSMISYDFTDILNTFAGKEILMQENVIDDWNTNDTKSLLDALSQVRSIDTSQDVHLHISFPESIGYQKGFELLVQCIQESLGGETIPMNLWQRDDDKLCVRVFYC